MNRKNVKRVFNGVFIGLCVVSIGLVSADDMADMQKQLNQETLAKPFSVPDEGEINKYIEQATKNNVKPVEYKGKHWKRGYTCADQYRYSRSYNAYRNCRYYHHYYGRYYW